MRISNHKELVENNIHNYGTGTDVNAVFLSSQSAAAGSSACFPSFESTGTSFTTLASTHKIVDNMAQLQQQH